MPIYTYRCESCGIRFEKTQKFSDAPLTRCPECGKKALQKVYTPVGIVFKGSGFYATDHRSPSGQSRSSNEKSSDSTPANTTPAEKSESKPISDTGKKAPPPED
jgi:putative FmdB family regulatory protein